MNAYQTFTQPWRSAFAVWTVMAQAQTDFALRAMGMTMPRMAARRSGPVPSEAPKLAPVALPGAPAAVETAPVPVVGEPSSAAVVPLRLVTEASASAIVATTVPPEAESTATSFVAAEEPKAEASAVLAEPQGDDLVQAAIRPLVAAVEGPPAALHDLSPEVVPATPASSRRGATGRGGKAKRNS